MKSLQGMFLVATNQMVDPRFRETVILICSHDEQGALGLVLTHPFEEITFQDILRSLRLEQGDIDNPDVYCGGPVSLDTLFVLHPTDLSTDSLNSTEILSGVFLGNDLRFVSYFVEHPGLNGIRFFLGYSGWGAGQLEQELGLDGWLVLPATPEDIFGCSPDSLWKQVTQKHGIDITLFNDVSGKA